MKPLYDCRLYCFVDTAYLHGRTPEIVARRLCEGGADLIQLRAKGAPLDTVRKMAEAILPITQEAGVGLVINDHLNLAREMDADLCHLGQEDFFGAGHTRTSKLKTTNSKIQIGLSTHSPEQAQRAMAAGADYIAIGPVFATATKPNAKPVTLDYVRWAAENVRTPWFAIGGINLQNFESVIEAGARRICVVSAILNSEDIVRTCREFKQQLEFA